MKRVLFCWDVINGYMASCFRGLNQRTEVDLKVLAIRSNISATYFEYSSQVSKGFSVILFRANELNDNSALVERIASFRPDIMFLCGWNIPAYAELIVNKKFADIPKVMTMDTNYLGTWRQFLAPLKIGRYLKKIDMLFVPGERSWQLARHWKIPEGKIRKGAYSMDYQAFSEAMEDRLALGQWPRKFLFAGQYIERKGVPYLLRAYNDYRKKVDNPWPLICCGAGPLGDELRSCAGIDERGFIQPNELPGIMAEAGAFVHPSLYDPWGVAIAEACAAGLPVLTTQGCASSVELIRDFHNGIVLPGGSSRPLLNGLLWIHENYENLYEMGRHAQELARPFSNKAWTKRVMAIVNELLQV
jgi:glycosyltransferase involved in cell wall biosynthesis